LPRVLDRIVERRVATNCQLVGQTLPDDQQVRATRHKLVACGYVLDEW
jgi:hypothetical protein